METAAIEKLDSLITESQTAQSPLLYPLDASESIVPIEVVYSDDETLELFHEIAWPSLDALNKRQQQTANKREMLSENTTRVQIGDGVAANAVLWNRFARRVKGYEWDGIDPDEWVAVTPELAAEIPSEHKSAAIVGLFVAKFEVERLKGKGYRLGATTYRVKQTYGPYTIYHVFGKQQEGDRREIANKSLDTQYQTGTTKVKSTTFTSLKPYIQLYDRTFDHLEGVTGADPDIGHRKDLVTAIWKQGAIDALMDYFEASRRDLKKN